jgi:hypothetical protein
MHPDHNRVLRRRLRNMKKRTTDTLNLNKQRKRTTTREVTYTTEVNGEPTPAYIKEEQTEEDGYERNKTTITVGKTTKTRYTIDRRELENRIDETATEEEDRIEQYGDLPF